MSRWHSSRFCSRTRPPTWHLGRWDMWSWRWQELRFIGLAFCGRPRDSTRKRRREGRSITSPLSWSTFIGRWGVWQQRSGYNFPCCREQIREGMWGMLKLTQTPTKCPPAHHQLDWERMTNRGEHGHPGSESGMERQIWVGGNCSLPQSGVGQITSQPNRSRRRAT